MALERSWQAIAAISLTADGTTLGVVTVPDTAGFKVKGSAWLIANTVPPLQVQIQRVISPTQMIVGPVGSTPFPNNFTDVSAYTVALNAAIGFPEQPKNKIKPDDIEQATYDSDPIVANRVIPVDSYGNFYNGGNGFPVNVISGVAPPISLGSLAIPAIMSQFCNALTYDEVNDSTIGNTEILSFYAAGNLITSATLTKTGNGWDLMLGAPEDFLLLETGGLFELEDGSGIILLES